MAQFVQLWKNRRHVISLLVDAAKEADREREREYRAAVTIQSWFRGCRLRAYLKYLNECATVIQRHFRGHLGRKVYRHRLKECVEEMRMSYYNMMATRIQRAWRGYYVRKYVFDYHTQRQYLSELRQRNEAVRQRLAEHQMREESERMAREERVMELRTEEEARRHHYMLSTQCMEGVFRPLREGRSQPLPFENQMRSLKFYRHPSRSAKQRSASCDGHVIVTTTTSSKTLPPLNLPPKLQGPFRDPGTVWRQKTKPLNPTLRVATDFNSEEVARTELRAKEWRERVVDDKFLPFSHTTHHYQPLLHTQSPYSRLLHGTIRFRDEDGLKNIHGKEFQTVIPPVPLFDKMNSTY